MNAKLLAMEKNRQSHVEGIIFKQKRREEKARCVQAKALCLNDNKENLVYVDETYNSDGSEGKQMKNILAHALDKKEVKVMYSTCNTT